MRRAHARRPFPCRTGPSALSVRRAARPPRAAGPWECQAFYVGRPHDLPGPDFAPAVPADRLLLPPSRGFPRRRLCVRSRWRRRSAPPSSSAGRRPPPSGLLRTELRVPPYWRRSKRRSAANSSTKKPQNASESTNMRANGSPGRVTRRRPASSRPSRRRVRPGVRAIASRRSRSLFPLQGGSGAIRFGEKERGTDARRFAHEHAFVAVVPPHVAPLTKLTGAQTRFAHSSAGPESPFVPRERIGI